MDITFEELKNKLLQFDEVALLELLQITREDLVDRFEDYIQDNYEYLVTQTEE